MKSYQNDDLIQRLRKGDQAAFREFYDTTFYGMCSYASQFNTNSDFAVDAVTESYLKVWNKTGDFDSMRALLSFLMITIRNTCLNELAKINRYPQVQPDEYNMAADNEELEKLQLKEILIDAMYREIESLPDQCKIIFQHRYFDDLSTNDIANRMQLSSQTVRNQLTRAYQLLRTGLLKKGLDNILVLVIICKIVRALY